MKILPVFLLALTACAPLHTANWVVITETPAYTIIQNRNDGKYLVYTDTTARANDIIKSALECATKVCVVQPHGVVTEVQRFDKQSKANRPRPDTPDSLPETSGSVPSKRY